MARQLHALHRDGFVVLSAAVASPEARRLGRELDRALGDHQRSEHVFRRRGALYAALTLNLLDLFPEVVEVLSQPAVQRVLVTLQAGPLGVVRALFLDKPPGRSWAIPWHQDVTIAVEDNTLASSVFTKPTTKAGVPHVEAPVDLLACSSCASISTRPPRTTGR